MTIGTILKKVPLFSLLPVEALDELIRSGHTLSFEQGQIVCEEGEESDAMYVILDGQLRVFKHDGEGQRGGDRASQSGRLFWGDGYAR